MSFWYGVPISLTLQDAQQGNNAGQISGISEIDSSTPMDSATELNGGDATTTNDKSKANVLLDRAAKESVSTINIQAGVISDDTPVANTFLELA